MFDESLKTLVAKRSFCAVRVTSWGRKVFVHLYGTLDMLGDQYRVTASDGSSTVCFAPSSVTKIEPYGPDVALEIQA